MGLRGPKRKRAVGKRGFPKKVLTEEELRVKNSKIRDRMAARKRDYAKEWKSRLEKEKLLTEEERRRQEISYLGSLSSSKYSCEMRYTLVIPLKYTHSLLLKRRE